MGDSKTASFLHSEHKASLSAEGTGGTLQEEGTVQKFPNAAGEGDDI
jgi:hypothetical protein